MAEDDADRANEREAEREAEIEDELERIDRDPDEVDAGDDDLGTQNAPRDEDRPDDLAEAEGEQDLTTEADDGDEVLRDEGAAVEQSEDATD